MPLYNHDDLEKYYQLVGLTNSMRNNVNQCIEHAMQLLSGSPQYLFVENEKDTDGKIEVTNLVLRTPDLSIEVNLTGPPHYTYRKLTMESVTMLALRPENMDWKNVDANSTLRVDLYDDRVNNISYYSAVGLNCRELLYFVKEYLFPETVIGTR
jgi:hypothetical protein